MPSSLVEKSSTDSHIEEGVAINDGAADSESDEEFEFGAEYQINSSDNLAAAPSCSSPSHQPDPAADASPPPSASSSNHQEERPTKKQKVEGEGSLIDPQDDSSTLANQQPPSQPAVDMTLDSFDFAFGDIPDGEPDSEADKGSTVDDQKLAVEPEYPESPEIPPKRKPAMTVTKILQTYSTNRLERIRRKAIKDARKEIQEEMERVVTQLPHEITSKFGELGYGKFGKRWYPMLLICPYDVAREDVRQDWYRSYEKALEGRVKFAHMGHWIGEQTYSTVPLNNFVPMQKATSAHTKAINAVKAKREKGKPFKESSEEAYLARAMDILDDLLQMTPEERRRQIPHTRHPFEDMSIEEWLRDMMDDGITVSDIENDIVDDESVDELSDVADDEVYHVERVIDMPSEDEQPPVNVKPSAKKAKVQKTFVSREEDKEGEPKVSPKKKKKKKTTKTETSLGATLDDSLDENKSIVKESRRGKKEPKKLAGAKKSKAGVRESYSSEAELDDEDIPSDDDKDDDDYDADADAEPINVVADLGRVDDLRKDESTRRKKKKDTPDKNKKKTTTKKSLIPLSEKSGKQKRDWIYSRFRSNERKIVPLLERLHGMTDSTSSQDIRNLLGAIDALIDEMCWKFIELHKVPSLLKPPKKLLKDRGESCSVISELREKMKNQYLRNKLDCDFDFPTLSPIPTSYLVQGRVHKRPSNGQSEDASRKRKAADARPPKTKSLDSVPRPDQTASNRVLGKAEKKRLSTGSSTVPEKASKQSQRSETPSAVKSEEPSQVPSEISLSRSKSVEKNLDNGCRKNNPTGSHGKRDPVELSKDEYSGRKSPGRQKSFRLNSLISSGGRSSFLPTRPAERAVSATVPQSEPSVTSSSANITMELPDWMRTPVTAPTLPKERLYGLAFLREMTSYLPSDKVNKNSVAIAIEKAVFEWASTQGQSSPALLDIYWKKVRAIVAAVCGKHSPGALMRDLMNGKFVEARNLVDLNDAKLWEYFQDES